MENRKPTTQMWHWQGLLGGEMSSLTPVAVRRQSMDCSIGAAETNKSKLVYVIQLYDISNQLYASSAKREGTAVQKLKATAWDQLTPLEEQTRQVSGFTRQKTLTFSFPTFLLLNIPQSGLCYLFLHTNFSCICGLSQRWCYRLSHAKLSIIIW